MTLRCMECERPSRWHVWYKDCCLPVGGGNIAYNSFCDEHAIEEMRRGREGWHVVCVKLVEDQYLPDGDRALSPPPSEKTVERHGMKCPECGERIPDNEYYGPDAMCDKCLRLGWSGKLEREELADKQKQGEAEARGLIARNKRRVALSPTPMHERALAN